MTNTTMIQQQTLDRAIKMLSAAGCEFRIRDADGNMFGELKEQDVKRQREQKRPYGQLVNYYKPMIENMKAYDVKSISANGFEAEELRGAVAAWCTKHWGLKSYTTCINSDMNTVELLRIE